MGIPRLRSFEMKATKSIRAGIQRISEASSFSRPEYLPDEEIYRNT